MGGLLFACLFGCLAVLVFSALGVVCSLRVCRVRFVVRLFVWLAVFASGIACLPASLRACLLACLLSSVCACRPAYV